MVQESTSLDHLVGSDSWAFFQTLHMDPGFLQLTLDQWPLDERYKEAKATTEHLRVVKDSAERGVKLGSDFLSAVKIEERYQNVLQVAENDRKRVPNQRKRHVESDNCTWFLHL